MNNRLQLILKLENLSPARLSDLMGIQRSGLSHILSGRNKPSFEFINKLLLKFPDINAEWLITGKGKPLKDSDPPLSNEKKNNDLFSSEQKEPDRMNNQNKFEEYDLNDDLPEGDNTISPNYINSPNLDNMKHMTVNEEYRPDIKGAQLQMNQIFTNNLPPIHKNRSVSRVIIFYNDGSFDELTHDKTEQR